MTETDSSVPVPPSWQDESWKARSAIWRASRDARWRLVRWAATWGVATAAVLNAALTAVFWPNAFFTSSLVNLVFAAPIGALVGLASLGVGLLARRMARRLFTSTSIVPATAAMLGVFGAGSGIAGALLYPTLPNLAWMLGIAVIASALGGVALGVLLIKADHTASRGPEDQAATKL